MKEEIQEYASYNVLARKALIGGVPIITLLIFLCLILVTGFGGLYFFDVKKGLFIPCILGVVLFLIRLKCMDDSTALDRIPWDIKALFNRLMCGSNVISLTSTDNSINRRRENVREWIKNNTHKK